MFSPGDYAIATRLPNTIYIEPISKEVHEQSLLEAFTPFGKIKTTARAPVPGDASGAYCARVEYESASSALKAVRADVGRIKIRENTLSNLQVEHSDFSLVGVPLPVPGKSLKILGLPESFEAADIRREFSAVTKCHPNKPNQFDKNRVSWFVEFSTEEAALAAWETMDGKSIGGGSDTLSFAFFISYRSPGPVKNHIEDVEVPLAREVEQPQSSSSGSRDRDGLPSYMEAGNAVFTPTTSTPVTAPPQPSPAPALAAPAPAGPPAYAFTPPDMLNAKEVATIENQLKDMLGFKNGEPGSTLSITGLNHGFDLRFILSLFGGFGSMYSASMVQPGSAMVTFARKADADRVVQSLNGAQVGSDSWKIQPVNASSVGPTTISLPLAQPMAQPTPPPQQPASTYGAYGTEAVFGTAATTSFV